ncbi:hypothetical protein Tco_0994893 [Tanacetum coccineum]
MPAIETPFFPEVGALNFSHYLFASKEVVFFYVLKALVVLIESNISLNSFPSPFFLKHSAIALSSSMGFDFYIISMCINSLICCLYPAHWISVPMLSVVLHQTSSTAFPVSTLSSASENCLFIHPLSYSCLCSALSSIDFLQIPCVDQCGHEFGNRK